MNSRPIKSKTPRVPVVGGFESKSEVEICVYFTTPRNKPQDKKIQAAERGAS